MPTPLDVARSDLASEILATVDGPGRVDLEFGHVPSELERSLLAYAATRNGAMRRAGTAVQDRYAAVAAQIWSRLGREPTVAEFASASGRARTPAHEAIVRLRASGRWGPPSDRATGTPARSRRSTG